MKRWIVILGLAGCAADDGTLADLSAHLADQASSPVDAALPPDLAPLDEDEDGLADSEELAIATAYLPYLSLSPFEQCATGGLLVRVRPHPADPTLVQIIYDHLYNADCGIQGHDGDDEVFGITVDPTVAPPAGIVAMRAASHQSTACERDSECGVCAGLTPCQTLPIGSVAWPVVWSSLDKHGSYVDAATSCAPGQTCLDVCTDNATPMVPLIVNAGEPGHPLVHDLTDQGFITTANAWTHMELFHYDPWKPGLFGGAGDISLDLVDDAFLAPACHAN
jgi:hypothetical protein